MNARSGFIGGVAGIIGRRVGAAPAKPTAPVAAEPKAPRHSPAVVRVLETMIELRQAIDTETVAVERASPQSSLDKIVEAKSLAETAYRGALAMLHAEVGNGAPLTAEAREELTQEAKLLVAASETNLRAVTLAKDAQKRMVELIVDTVKKHRQAERGYAHLARTAASPYQRPTAPPPAAINRVY